MKTMASYEQISMRLFKEIIFLRQQLNIYKLQDRIICSYHRSPDRNLSL